jgi:hypothetical protein
MRVLDARGDPHGLVFGLFDEVDFAANAAEPKVFHPTHGSFTNCRCWMRHVEYIHPALPEVMEWLAALWIRAVIHHRMSLVASYGARSKIHIDLRK